MMQLKLLIVLKSIAGMRQVTLLGLVPVALQFSSQISAVLNYSWLDKGIKLWEKMEG